MGLSSFNKMRRQQEALRKELTSEKGVVLEEKSFNDLRALAKELGMEKYGSFNKEQLIEAIKANQNIEKETEPKEETQE